jgi:hypothetical protein
MRRRRSRTCCPPHSHERMTDIALSFGRAQGRHGSHYTSQVDAQKAVIAPFIAGPLTVLKKAPSRARRAAGGEHGPGVATPLNISYIGSTFRT